jgi:hypothetical protein
VILGGIFLANLGNGSFAQSCGNAPPTNVQWSDSFKKGVLRILDQTAKSSSSADLNVLVPPVSGALGLTSTAAEAAHLETQITVARI